MPNIWFSSDFHFSHINLNKSTSQWKNKNGCRDFPNIDIMNETLITNINSNILQNDILYFLGDFAFGIKDNLRKFRELINCNTIHFIRGNHEKLSNEELRKYFSSVNEYWHGKINKQYCVLNHYCMRIWPFSSDSSWMIYGHSHGNIGWELNTKSIDVGIDTEWKGHKKYTPYHFDEIHKLMTMKTIVNIDHHNGEQHGN